MFEVLNFKIDLSEISITLYATGLFFISMQLINISHNKVLEKIGEKYSVGIYLFHIAISGVLSKFLRIVEIDDLVVMWIKPIMVVLLSILWSMILFYTVSFVKERLVRFE